MNRSTVLTACLTLGSFLAAPRAAFALPAFALRENVSCTLCHANGSAPHLTEVGYKYRRAGFRFPENIGNDELTEQDLKVLNHLAVGLNADYEATTLKPPGGTNAVTQNNFDFREVEIWPAVGAFFGNFGVWSEVDMDSPTFAAALSLADIRYVKGDSNFFYSVRTGYMASEGYGASDQWIDDGALPAFDLVAASHNESTLALPLGAMNWAQLGAEVGFNWPKTYLTAGVYNGFNGTNGLGTGTQSTLQPGWTNSASQASKDFKFQWDQLFEAPFALTAIYYNGRIPMLDPSNSVMWNNNYQMARLYGTWFAVPSVLDVVAGTAWGRYGYVESGSGEVAGHFMNAGAFVGGNYYVKPHLTLSARVDAVQYDSSTGAAVKAVSLLASLPYENNIFVFHYTVSSDSAYGLQNDFRSEWRFLY